ncbi:MAG: class I SAM-dependent methyltransferase [Spirochaetia bacterium]|nr:class I SAM-dependent methyltransferase [Spirochaetia bacterium]
MTKPRISETDNGIQGELVVQAYDEMERGLRDKGWMETGTLLGSGITTGHALEIGHGPGYLGLEWLKLTEGTTLTGLDISPDMQALAQRNASDYGFDSRTDYQLGNCNALPFAENSFDAVFTNGSLHEWEEPSEAFNEMWRVLKSGGRYFISDLRRDMGFVKSSFLWLSTRPVSIRRGLLTSIHAAYTPAELRNMIAGTALCEAQISGNWIGVTIQGMKH